MSHFNFQMFTGLLKHTPPLATTAAASSSSSSSSSSSALDQNSNAQTTNPTIPRGHLVFGPKDQLRLLTPVGSTTTSNHCTATVAHTTKHSGGAPRPPSSLSEEDDGGGGGRVKKKRKKKDKQEWERVVVEDRESSKPKRRRDEREVTVVTLRKSKEPKQGKEKKDRRSKGKECKKERGAGLKNVAIEKLCVATGPAQTSDGVAQVPIKVPGKRGRKPKVKILPPLPANQGTYVGTCGCYLGIQVVVPQGSVNVPVCCLMRSNTWLYTQPWPLVTALGQKYSNNLPFTAALNYKPP